MKARRKPITFLLAAALLGALFTAYLHFGVLPGDLRTYALRKIGQLTGKRVTFDKTLFLPFQGLTFYNLRITDPAGNVLFGARKLRLDAELMTFFREKKIVINRAYLEGPVFTTVFNPLPPKNDDAPVMTKLSGQIPVPVVPEGGPDARALQDGPDALLPENVYLQELEILDGRVRVLAPDGKLIEDVRDINVVLRFTKPPVLLFDGSLKLGTKPYASLFLRGGWNLDTAAYEFRFQSKSSAVPAWLVNYQRKNFLVMKSGRSVLSVHLRNTPDGEALFRAETDLRDAELAARGGETYSGEMTLAVDGTFNFDQRRLTRYKGTLDFVDVAVKGLPGSLPPLENLSGALHFQPDLLEARAVRGQYRQLVFSADGRIRSFKDLNLDARVRVNAPLADLIALLPAADREKLDKLVLEGRCESVTNFTGSLKNAAKIRLRHSLALNEGAVRDAGGKWAATDVSAQVLSDDAGFKVKTARFTFGKKRYALDATIPKNPGNTGKFDLRGDDFRFSSDYTKSGDGYAVKNARLASSGLEARFDGAIAKLEKPVLNLHGNLTLDLVRSRTFIAERFPGLKDAALAGTLAGKFVLRGPAASPIDWDFQMDATGAPVFVKERFRLDDLEIQVRYKNRALNLPYYRGTAYGGSLGGRAFIDLSRPEATFNGKFYANSVDLADIARDLALKLGDLSGKLLLDVNLKGVMKDNKTWTGAGTMDIKDGQIWKTDLFKQMGELPFVKVIGLDQVVFTRLHAPFTVRGARIWSNDLRLGSETVDLLFKGSMGFDGALDFIMTIGYTDNVITGALDTGGIVPFVIEKASGMISQYKITGTLKKPKSEKLILPAVQAAIR